MTSHDSARCFSDYRAFFRDAILTARPVTMVLPGSALRQGPNGQRPPSSAIAAGWIVTRCNVHAAQPAGQGAA
jgi:hypothetical protein